MLWLPLFIHSKVVTAIDLAGNQLGIPS